jgi:hypothetical protein
MGLGRLLVDLLRWVQSSTKQICQIFPKVEAATNKAAVKLNTTGRQKRGIPIIVRIKLTGKVQMKLQTYTATKKDCTCNYG